MKKSVTTLLTLWLFLSLAALMAQQGNWVTHTVQKGETAYSITKQYGVTYEQIMQWNNLQNLQSIQVGSTLIVGYGNASSQDVGTRSLSNQPAQSQQPRFYTVRTNDTFYGIARAHNTDPKELQRLNPSADPNHLSVGQQLVVGYFDAPAYSGAPPAYSGTQQDTRSMPAASGQNARAINSDMWKKAYPNMTEEEIRQQLQAFQEVWKTITTALNQHRTYVVIVGVSDYPNVRSLRYCDDDAYEFYAHIRSLEGGATRSSQIAVLIDENATKANVLRALQEKFSQADETDNIIFYYAGHGVPTGLIPQDYSGNNVLTYEEIGRIMGNSRAKTKIGIIDACHSGGAAYVKGQTSQADRDTYAAMAQNLDQAMRRSGRFALFSSTKEEESLEFAGVRHGLFTHFLIEGLKGASDIDGNRIITLGELYNYIETNVRTKSQGRQNPMILGQYDPDYIISIVRKP